ncbi:MAG: putative DNA binding domain-containing protein [Candidatus Dadabacteria bacterium]|nr:putative DNA binding domain-containing protein [Candidatus Dadabacteria bacterium]
MTRTELLEIIANGENSGVEFKRDTLENYSLAKELVAFSNLDGGLVLLGVDDDGSIKGITRDHVEQWVMNACRDKIRPGIIPFFEIIKDIQSGKDVAVVRVPRGGYVYSQWHNNKHTYYIRVGTQSRETDPQELGRLFQQRGLIRAEMSPVSGTTIKDLDHRRLKNYFEHVRQQNTPDDSDDTGWRNLLINTDIITEDGVTIAGILLFGITPNRYLPQAGIDAVAYSGTEKDYEAKERSQLHGAMTPLIDQNGNLMEAGLVEQAVYFVRRNTPVHSRLKDGARRVDTPTYPEEVIRETIVNALIHRDYLLSGTDIELAVYENRLEVISPGKLPNGITPERTRLGVRAARNDLLKDFMRDYGYLEHMGMGIPRKIIKGMKEHNGSVPELIEENERFTVRLFSTRNNG